MPDWLARALAHHEHSEPQGPGRGARAKTCHPPDKMDRMDKTARNEGSGGVLSILCDPEALASAPSDVAPPFASGPLGDWQRALMGLDPGSPPCPGFRNWSSVLRHAQRFLDEHGEEAIALGWGVLDLFGVHREVGAVRGDCSGALLGLRGVRVVQIDAHLIRFANGLAYRRRPMLPGLTIPVWEFRTTTKGKASC